MVVLVVLGVVRNQRRLICGSGLGGEELFGVAGDVPSQLRDMENGVKTGSGWQVQLIVEWTRAVIDPVWTKELRLELGGGRLDMPRAEIDEVAISKATSCLFLSYFCEYDL